MDRFITRQLVTLKLKTTIVVNTRYRIIYENNYNCKRYNDLKLKLLEIDSAIAYDSRKATLLNSLVWCSLLHDHGTFSLDLGLAKALNLQKLQILLRNLQKHQLEQLQCISPRPLQKTLLGLFL